MSLANDSAIVSVAASGATIATQLAGGKEHQAVVIAGPDGHLQDSFPTYYYWSGFAAGATNRKALEVFNAVGSGVKVIVRKIFIQTNMVAAVHIGQQWDFDKSSAVGTGGTIITGRPVDSNNLSIPAQVTARTGPSGGATKNFTLFSIGLDGEETRPAAGLMGMINWVPEGPNSQEIILHEGEGFYVMQITNSTTTIWGVLFVVNIL